MKKKLISAALVVAMVLSVTACGEGGIESKMTTETYSTQAPIENGGKEPNQPIDPGVIISTEATKVTTETESETQTETETQTEATEEPTEGYTQDTSGFHYTAFGMDIYLPVNIDDWMIISDKGRPTFLMAKLAEEYGWVTEDFNVITYYGDDYRIEFTCSEAGGDFEQTPIQRFAYVTREPKNGELAARYANTDQSTHPVLYRNLVVKLEKASESDRYAVIAPSSPLAWTSKDMVILIAYVLTSECRTRGENPFCYIDAENYHHPENDSYDRAEYHLP